MNEYKCVPLDESVEEMFIGPFGSSLKNECFVDEDEAYCMVYEQKHAIQKTMDVETRYVNEQKYNELKRFNIHGGDIIVSCRGTIGETFVVPEDAPLGIMHPSIMKIRLKDGVYDKYYFNLLLKSRLKKHEAEANGSGIKMAISATELGRELFPVPMMQEQQEITDIISGISDVIEKRKQELSALDDLIKARFVELFGDPVINSKGWSEALIGDNCFVTKLAGFEYTQYINYDESGDVVMVKAQNVKNGKLNRKELSFISNEVSDSLPRSQLASGDIVMTYVGANIGDVAVIDDKYKYHLAPNVAKIRPDSEIYDPTYFMYMLMLLNTYIVKNSADTAKAALGMERIRKLKVFTPPIETQRQFADFAHQVDKSKFIVIEGKNYEKHI